MCIRIGKLLVFLTFEMYIYFSQTEDDGRVFPVSNNSSSVIDCLLSEAKCRGGMSLRLLTVTTGYLVPGFSFFLEYPCSGTCLATSKGL